MVELWFKKKQKTKKTKSPKNHGSTIPWYFFGRVVCRCTVYMLCDKEEFASFLRYARSLQFAEEPNYTLLKNLFKGLMQRNGWPCDWNFDWINISLVSLAGSTLLLSDLLSTCCLRVFARGVVRGPHSTTVKNFKRINTENVQKTT